MEFYCNTNFYGNRDPIKNPKAALEKRNDVLKSMLEVDYLTQEEYETYSSQSLKIVQEETEGTNGLAMISPGRCRESTKVPMPERSGAM